MPLAFGPHKERNALHRDAGQQFRSFARLASPRSAATTQNVRPWRSVLDIQLQFYPALWRLSVIIFHSRRNRNEVWVSNRPSAWRSRQRTLNQREPGLLRDLFQKRLMFVIRVRLLRLCHFRLGRLLRLCRLRRPGFLRVCGTLAFREKYFGLLCKPFLRIGTSTPHQ